MAAHRTVGGVVRGRPRTCPRTTSVLEAAQLMAELDLGAVVVTSGGKHLAGVVTGRDIAVHVVAEGRRPEQVTLGEIMHSDLVMVQRQTMVERALARLREAAAGHLVVLDGDEVVGVAAVADCARGCESEQGWRASPVSS